MRKILYLILGIIMLLGIALPAARPVLADSSGPNPGSTFASVSFTGADNSWSSPGNAATSNDARATATVTGPSDVTYYLRATGFGFSIPAGSTIDGIEVHIERSAVCVSSCTSNVRDNRVRIVKTGTVGTTDRADTTTNWPATDATATYGGASDLWGTTWTVADINSATTGVVISAGRNTGGDKTARVDYISMTVYYTPPITYTITATAGAGGTITPSGAVSVNEGNSQTFDIPPNTSYIVSDVVVDSVSQGRINSYTFTNVTANHTIDASFENGWKEPTLSTGGGVGNPTYAYTSNNQRAQYNSDSDVNSYFGFGFSIPGGSTIDGIAVSIEGRRDSTSSTTWDVSLSYDGGTTWTATKNTGSLQTYDTTIILGGSSDDWGYGSWTPAIINSNNFRVRMDATGGGDSIWLDQVQVKLYYTSQDCSSVQVQLALILDGSTSITTDNFTAMKNGLAAAIENASGCFRHDGSVELTVVQVGLMGSVGAAVEVYPTVITADNADDVATTIRGIGKRNGYTPLACAFYLATDTLYDSPCFSTGRKQVINLVTDGIPTRCCPYDSYNSSGCNGCPTTGCTEAMDSTVVAQNYTITTLGMTTDQDEIDAEFIGVQNENPDPLIGASGWLRTNIVWPGPGYYAPPFSGPGWVNVIEDGQGYADSICAKLTQVTCIITVSLSGSTTFCEGDSTTITANASGGTLPYTYAWSGTASGTDNGDGTFTATNSGTLSVTVTDVNLCSPGTDDVIITVNQAPTANFTAVPVSGPAPLTVQFNDTSTGSPNAWAWDFNEDGITDNITQNPSYEYSAPGTYYDVTLIVTNTYGCSDDEIKTDYITVGQAPTAPTVSIEIYATQDCSGIPVTAMDPLTTYYAKVSIITNGEQLNQLQTVQVTLFYVSDNSTPAAPVIANTQTCAILTCTIGGPPGYTQTFSITPLGGGTTWQLGTCIPPGDLNGTIGDWIFAFTPGQVATESILPAHWEAQGLATNKSSLSGDMYVRNKAMNWYGEITVLTPPVNWGDVQLGLRFGDAPNPKTVSIKYIANGDYYEDIQSSATWQNPAPPALPTDTVTLSTGDPPTNPGEFALMADNTTVLGSAIAVTISYDHINDSGGLTTEDGVTITDNGLWLSLSTSGILPVTYSGDIHYRIVKR